MGRRFATLSAVSFVIGCGAPRPPLLCADGALPCPNQVMTFTCDTLAPGSLPPDAAEVAWMLDGAKVPDSTEPPVSLDSWCSGTLVAAGLPMHVELFRGIDGGYLQAEGRDRLWFQASPEDPAAKRARTCIRADMPSHEEIAGAACTPVGKRPFDAAAFGALYARAKPADLTTFGTPDDPLAVCQVSIRGGGVLRADLFAGDKGWFRLPGQKRVCFTARPG